MIKVGSDCSGVGALIQALKRLNIDFEESFSCDFDYHARLTYLHNYGTREDMELALTKEHKFFCKEVKRIALLSDKELELLEEKEISENEKILIEANEFAKLFSFYYPFNMYQRDIPKEPLGFYASTVPCQAFSLAGKRAGEDDKRGVLFYNSHGFIKKNNPRFFLFENVKGLVSDDSGKTFQKWIDLLGGKTVNGNPVLFPNDDSVPYHVYYKVLNAKDFNIPQNRERIFIVGIRDDQDNNFNWPKPVPLEKRLRDILEENVDPKYCLSDTMMDWLVGHSERSKEKGSGFSFKEKEDDDILNAINARMFKMGVDDNYVKVKSATKNGYETAHVGDSINLSQPNSETRRGRVGKGVLQTLDTACNQAVYDYVNDSDTLTMFGNSQDQKLSPLNGCMQTMSAGHFNQPKIYDGSIIRRITPREAFRGMDFPDSFTWPVSDTQAYRQAGNSIPVGMLAAILEKLLKNY